MKAENLTPFAGVFVAALLLRRDTMTKALLKESV